MAQPAQVLTYRRRTKTIKVLVSFPPDSGMRESITRCLEFVNQGEGDICIRVVDEDELYVSKEDGVGTIIELILSEGHPSREFLRKITTVHVVLFCINRNSLSKAREMYLEVFRVLDKNYSLLTDHPKKYLVGTRFGEVSANDKEVSDENMFQLAEQLKCSAIYYAPPDCNISLLIYDCSRDEPYFSKLSPKTLTNNILMVDLKNSTISENLEKIYKQNEKHDSISSEYILFEIPLLKFPKFISNFNTLTTLNLSNNFIHEEGCVSNIFSISTLKFLKLSRNLITCIPIAVGYATNLIELHVQHNLITTVSSHIKHCTNLKDLNLSYNKIKIIPPAIGELPHSYLKLNVENNPVVNVPEEILQKGGEVLLNYLKELKLSPEKGKWTRMKVFVVGEEGVGKTHLVTALSDKKYKINLSTDGIKISEIQHPGDDISFKFFDFGGQEVFYPTHHFFLTKGALYMVMFNLLKIDWIRLEYWLQTISTLSKTTPIVLVGTHLDKFKGKKSDKEEIEQRIQKLKGANRIKKKFFISCKNKANISEIRSTLVALSKEQNLMKSDVPLFYLKLEKIVRNSTEKYLQWIDYAQLANQKPNDESLKHATEFLHDVGSLIWFNNSNLEDIVILDVQWLASVMATLVSFKYRFEGGRLQLSLLQNIWKEYPVEMHKNLLGLLHRFQITFPVAGSEKDKLCLIPCMFPIQPSKEYKEALSQIYYNKNILYVNEETKLDRFERIYKFPFLPLGLFSRLIVRLLQDVVEFQLESIYWRDGIMFKNSKGQRGLLEFNATESEIRVVTISEKKSSSDNLFTSLIHSIESMIASLKKMKLERLAVCSHCFYHSDRINKISYYSDQELVTAFKLGLDYVICNEVPVFLEDIAPDICLTHVKSINANITNLDKLGEGAFGVVYKGLLGKLDVALKEIKQDIEINQYQEFTHEVFIMSKLHHPNLVNLYGIKLNPLSMVMEYCPHGSLSELLYYTKREFSNKLKYRIALDIACGINYLHTDVFPPIIHRDLRSPNIFIVSLDDSAPVIAKVGDFGLAQHAAPVLSEMLKAWQWLAPETLDACNSNYDHTSDIYSIAIIISEVFTLRRPFIEFHQYIYRRVEQLQEEYLMDNIILNKLTEEGWIIDKEKKEAILEEFNEQEIKKAIAQGLRPSLSKDMNENLKSLIKRCWSTEPQLRPPAKEVIQTLEKIANEENFDCHALGAFGIDTQFIDNKSKSKKNLVTHYAEINYSHLNDRLICIYSQLVDKVYKIWCGSANGNIYCFETDLQTTGILNNVTINSLKLPNPVRVNCILISENILWIGTDAGNIYITFVNEFGKINPRHLDTHSAPIQTINATANYVVFGDSSGKLSFWNIKTQKPWTTINIFASPITSIIVSPTDLTVSSSQQLITLKIEDINKQHIFDVQFNNIKDILSEPANRLWVTTNDGIIVCENKSRTLLTSLPEAAKLFLIKKKSGKYHIWSTTTGKSLLIWSLKKLKCILEIRVANSVEFINQLNTNTIVTGSSDGTKLNFWQYKNKT